MKALKTKISGNHTIITGITQLIIDPNSTQAFGRAKLKDVKEFKDLQAKAKKKGNHFFAAGVAGKRAKESLRQIEFEKGKPVFDDKNEQHKIMDQMEFQNGQILKRAQSDRSRYEKERTDNIGAAGVCNTELIELDKECKKKYIEVMKADPIFCHPTAGCLIDRGTRVAGWIDEHEDESGALVPGFHAVMEDMELEGYLVPEGQTVQELITAWMGKQEREVCTINGEYIDDFRGVTFWKKVSGTWQSRLIDDLGVKPGTTEKEMSALTDLQRSEINNQLETARISEMSAEDKTVEYASRKSDLVMMAQEMENELKFDGDADYMTKAQAWYNTELAILKTKYGVTV